MPTLFSPFGLATKIAEKVQADGHDTIALDAGFMVDELQNMRARLTGPNNT